MEQSFRETVLLDARLPADAAPSPADPHVRERTLMALANLKQIPALQSLARGFAQVAGRTDVSVEEIVSSIEKDSALCVRVLGMANSVGVGSEQRIEDLGTAVQMLGVKRIHRLAQALFTLRDAQRMAEGLDWRHLWIHAFATAALAEELERRLRPSTDSQIHLAALLHDVGKIVLSTVAAETYREVLVAAWNGAGRLEDLERARLGVEHREAGVIFAQHHRLPPVVIAAVAHHAAPELAETHRFEVALVSVANYLSKARGLGFSGARLEEGDVEFEDLSAWVVIQEECGRIPDLEVLQEELEPVIAGLRTELRGLREASSA